MTKKLLEDLTEEELLHEIARRRAEKLSLDVTAIEDDVEDVAERVKQALLDERIDALPPEDATPKPCPRCGRRVRVRRRAVVRTVRTRVGHLELVRNYHYCDHCTHGFFPRDSELGLPEEGAVSFGLEERILDFGINDTFEEAARRWQLHYPTAISENLVRRVVDRVGKRIEAADDRYLQHALSAPCSRPSDLILVQNDGSMVPTREGWKEAKMAVIVRQEHHTSHRQVRRGYISQARYVAVVGAQEEFYASVDKTLQIERARRAQRIVWLADGALGNWRLAQELAPGCTQILDWYHAVEHAVACGRALLGEEDPGLVDWKRTCERLLMGGQVEQIIEQLLDCLELTDSTGHAAINDLVRYYRNNRLRMNYSRYLREGLPIGNGAAESAHRHVLQVRMKRAGQRWSLPRARRMARLRAAYRTTAGAGFHRAIRIAAEATRVAAIPRRKGISACGR